MATILRPISQALADWDSPDRSVRNRFGIAARPGAGGAFPLGVIADHMAVDGKLHFAGRRLQRYRV